MRILGGVLATILGASNLLAQAADVPLHNWTVPPFARSSAGGITTMTDVTPPRVFVGVQPCRVVDTRGNGAPIQGGIFTNSEARNWTVWGVCGIPSGADAISVNFSVVSPAGTPLGAFLLAWPTGQPPPPTAVMTYGPGATVISNAAIVPLNASGQLTVNVSHSTHIVMDVNGYFSDTTSGTAPLDLTVNVGGFNYVAGFTNNATDCSGPCGVRVVVKGTNSSAISGTAAGTSGQNAGVVGGLVVLTTDSAGVYGFAGLGNYSGGYGATGVRGQGQTNGVVGIGAYSGVAGDLVNSSAPFSILARGVLGYNDGASPPYGVYSQGKFAATGTKSFVEPHPTDASKVIRYVSLEGPEAGTYFRGRGRFERGMARIRVPEDFRLVSDAEGLTVQVTPIGSMASFAVVRADLNEIVVQSSRNVEFYYLVQRVRRTFKDWTPIADGGEYRPDRADASMPAWLSEAQKQLLIQNGTYKLDGSVNLETAKRLGWDRIWETRSPPVEATTPQ